MCFASKNYHCPIGFSLFFNVFSKPLPATVVRGSRCRSLLKKLDFGAMFDFKDFPKGAFYIFAITGAPKTVHRMTPPVLAATMLFFKSW